MACYILILNNLPLKQIKFEVIVVSPFHKYLKQWKIFINIIIL